LVQAWLVENIAGGLAQVLSVRVTCHGSVSGLRIVPRTWYTLRIFALAVSIRALVTCHCHWYQPCWRHRRWFVRFV